MPLSSGVDLVEIQRLQAAIDRHGERFLNRIFTPRELEEVGQNTASLAARFAAKEAVSKALGTGIGPVNWHEIEILPRSGAPAAAVSARRCRAPGTPALPGRMVT